MMGFGQETFFPSEPVGYDAFGRPVYNRNARQARLAIPGSIDALSLGQDSLTTQTGGGGGALGAMQNVSSALSLGKNAYESATGRSPLDDILSQGNSFGPGTPAGGLLNPTEFGAFGPAPEGFTGPTFNSAWGAADAIDAAGGVAGSLGAGAGSSTLAAATSTATGPGGLLAGGGATSLAPAGAAAAGLGSWLGTIAPPLAVMYAIMQLGGAFTPDTQKLGIETDKPLDIGPDGISAPNWRDESNYGMVAPGSYYTAGNELYDALNTSAGAQPIDPSWFNGGIHMNYGSDADIGLDNPQANIIFQSGNYQPTTMGSEQTLQGGLPLDIDWHTRQGGGITGDYSTSSFDDMMARLAAGNLPLHQAAPTWQSFDMSPRGLSELMSAYVSDPTVVSGLANLYKAQMPDMASGDLVMLAQKAWEDQNRA